MDIESCRLLAEKIASEADTDQMDDAAAAILALVAENDRLRALVTDTEAASELRLQRLIAANDELEQFRARLDHEG